MKAVAKREAEREVAVLRQIDFSGQRDIAVRRRGELPIQLEILIQVLPSVGLADIAAGAPHERHAGSQSHPGVVLVRGQKLVPGHPRDVGIVAPSADIQMRREQHEHVQAT